ncbi:sugar porter family MFS transporter [Fulvivirgaceae bacterium BMA12]|uniref:Sugar porter family MFS transporter n=1 Tax=Agaribacillus aureus TaxID=3051825 RepID=A0ABT8L5F6_9BACT|nr:sugar porter family MFS transporter [Fulvivirgaceae bacterium BMA12]
MQSNLIYVVRVSLVATLGGLLFGYDTAVIAGAIGYLRIHFELSPELVGWAASCALLGCVFGALLSGVLSDRLGRKNVLLLAAVFFLISALGTALPKTFSQFILFRILGGIGVGAASMASPMYIAELSPARYRGSLVSLNQLAIIAGMLIVYFANYFIAGYGAGFNASMGVAEDSVDSWNVVSGWRWMFGSEAIPALLLLVLLFFVPDSPRWLLKRNREKNAMTIIGLVEGAGNAEVKMREIKESLSEESATLDQLVKPGLRMALIVGLGLAFFQQSTGINVILYFAPEILKGISKQGMDVALLQTIIIGAVNLAFTVVGILAVDKVGRRPLMLWGYSGMGISLLALGIGATLQLQGVGTLLFILGYVACFAFSVGPVTWVILAEIFPTKMRGRAMAIATIFLWMTNFMVSQTFPMMDGHAWLVSTFNHGFPFIIYGILCGAALFFVWRYVPETKNKSLESIREIWKVSSLSDKNEQTNASKTLHGN